MTGRWWPYPLDGVVVLWATLHNGLPEPPAEAGWAARGAHRGPDGAVLAWGETEGMTE